MYNQGNFEGRLSKMSQSINRIQKRAKEIRKELWGAMIFFTLGVLVAEFAFSQIGDNFMYDIQTESLGKLPVYDCPVCCGKEPYTRFGKGHSFPF